ncbi:nitronate monooxygenase [Achromobacter denitrificans]|uniref:NAD(P)H-dependent flavin oxidoreductase n=1 Tax=Achromobacter denitrificans TaxID=32002 RepID=UPI000F50FF25|nr:nitronate monooxygenase family protein [Achromobacter denitrificans]MBV2162423.1 nitronate monooxygenase family protein [Achromobacter denitrificans]MDX3879298.1 nitronate monooxygenase family protein [Achromobacter sp.]QCS66212.1 nitronate monooxygenase [Achromobacter denitrificans]WFC65718.1 nitronate monooxygenase [Achromobacter denitrificans]
MTWFKSLTLAGRDLLPIVQGGMGVGVSAHRLAGAVASQNAVGTIASVDLRHHHPDLLEKTERCHDRDLIDSANLEALHREVRAALDKAQGRGLVAVNVMKAVRDHPALVRQACESGAQAIVMGAGLPLDLPEMTADFPKVALVPILSEARGVAAVLKKWMKKGRLADAVVIEHPGHAGGHLGAARLDDLHDERFDFKRVLADCHKLFEELQLGKDAPRLIVAGGVGSHEQVRHWLANGADGVQVGTAFAVTREGDAHENFKRVLIDADPTQLTEFTSVAGLPARAVPTPWLTRYLRQEKTLQANTRCDARRCSQRMDCLTQCGLRDGISRFGQFCIDLKLAAAMRGEVSRGLFFRGASKLPFGSAMRSVRELLDYLLHGEMPATA